MRTKQNNHGSMVYSHAISSRSGITINQRKRRFITSSFPWKKHNSTLPCISILLYIASTIHLVTSFFPTQLSSIITTLHTNYSDNNYNNRVIIPRHNVYSQNTKGTLLYFHSQSYIHNHQPISPLSPSAAAANDKNKKGTILQSTIDRRKDFINREKGNYIRMIMALHDDATDSETASTNTNINNRNNVNENANTNIYKNTRDNNEDKSLSSSSSSPTSEISNTQLKSSIEKTKSIVINSTRNKRKKYKRKRPKPITEKEREILKRNRQKQYEELMSNGKDGNIWDFESLFPAPKWDEETIHRDLYEVAERDALIKNGKKKNDKVSSSSSSNQYSPLMSPKVDSILSKATKDSIGKPVLKGTTAISPNNRTLLVQGINNNSKSANIMDTNNKSNGYNSNSTKVDRSLTRMVEDRLYGFRRGQMGEFEYDTSLMGDGAVKFRDGIRLGNALKVNADRLNYFAKREMIHGKLEEAEELYEQAIKISPQDGRSYLGLARIAERRRDLKMARQCLLAGINKSRMEGCSGANPFLLQALGNLEEKAGHLSEAENLYIDAAKSRPSHAAAWVSLAQLRTRKLRQGPDAGRICYETAERELKKAGLPPSSYVYTAWAGLECKAGNIRRARDLFQKAFEVDPKCSAAWLQLGVMETNAENWDRAKECFETVLKFDNRNSRVLQAYALMESKRPDGNSRDVIELFEKALRANPRDGGVLQAYGLYVAKLGDIDSARDLLRRGTEIDKRHAPLWQAWGVLETRYGSPSDAREIFQQGIWACAQPSGGQSGGRHCSRLWQAWGVLEAKECDYAAARRCFSRALDADNRNVATITAWTLMEQQLGRYKDAKLIFERSLRQFSSFSDEKLAIWRAYELMEVEAGNLKAAQNVYQRSIRDSMSGNKFESSVNYDSDNLQVQYNSSKSDDVLKTSSEVEVSRWNSMDGFGDSDVWMNDGSIEGKVPASAMKKGKK